MLIQSIKSSIVIVIKALYFSGIIIEILNTTVVVKYNKATDSFNNFQLIK